MWAIQLPQAGIDPGMLDFQSTYSIQDSTYSFFNLTPGEYRIYAEIWVSGNLYSASTTLTISSSEVNMEVDLTLI